MYKNLFKNTKRIAIIGQNGAGKTTFSNLLNQRLPLGVIHMDSYIWGPNWTLNDRDKAEVKIKSLLHDRETWIADGYINYAPQEILQLADLVIYLDYSRTVSLVHKIKRWIKHRKTKRAELPEGCEEKMSVKTFVSLLDGGVVKMIEEALIKYSPKNILRVKSPRHLKKLMNENFG